MATEKQLHANRANARRSTGPRTAAGKARASQNALKTGLYAEGNCIAYENPAQLIEIEQNFTAEFHPVTAAERSLVDSLIHLEWMLRRYRWVETEVWRAAETKLTPDQLTPGWPGHAFVEEPAIARLHRLRASTLKAFRETLADLQALQSTSEAQENKAPEDEIGFVPPDPLPECEAHPILSREAASIPQPPAPDPQFGDPGEPDPWPPSGAPAEPNPRPQTAEPTNHPAPPESNLTTEWS